MTVDLSNKNVTLYFYSQTFSLCKLLSYYFLPITIEVSFLGKIKGDTYLNPFSKTDEFETSNSTHNLYLTDRHSNMNAQK